MEDCGPDFDVLRNLKTWNYGLVAVSRPGPPAPCQDRPFSSKLSFADAGGRLDRRAGHLGTRPSGLYDGIGRKRVREIRRDHIGRDNRDHAVKSIWIFSQIRVPRSSYRNMTDTTIEPCGWSCYHARTDPLGFPRNLDGKFDQVYDTSIETKNPMG